MSQSFIGEMMDFKVVAASANFALEANFLQFSKPPFFPSRSRKIFVILCNGSIMWIITNFFLADFHHVFLFYLHNVT